MNAPAKMHEMKINTPLPMSRSGAIPVEPYISPEYFKKEQEKIFKRAWLNVGRVNADMPNPGDYFVRELEVINASILLVHGRDGVVRGFHNVCTHRGNSVAKDKGNARTAFVCAFHGWAFGLDGSLRTVPSEEQFPGLDRSQYGLKPVTTEVWNGFIFINAQAKPTTSLVDFLGGILSAKKLEIIPFDKFEHIARYSTVQKCNWKTFSAAFQEAYHVGIVHAESLSQMAAKPDVLEHTSTSIYGSHSSHAVWGDPEHKATPAEAIAVKYGGSFTPEKAHEKPAYLNVSHDENVWFDVHVLFPNLTILMGAVWYATYTFNPVSADETYWEVNLYHLPASTPGQKIAQEYTKDVLRDVLYEDLSTMEGVHKGLKSGVLKNITFGNLELTPRHHYWAVEQWVNAA